MDLGAAVSLKLTSRHYRRSPLVQGGMEIACLVTARIPATMKNTEIAELYIKLVKERYTEPKEEEILGCYVTDIEDDEVVFEVQGKTNGRKAQSLSENQQPAREKQKHKQLDIKRTLFAGARNQPNQRGASSGGKEQGNKIIESD